jgi:predicted dehydrogenase
MVFPSSMPVSRVPDPAAAPPLKWGVMAPGWIAHAFASAARTFTRQELVAVGSRRLSRAQEFAGEFGIKSAYGSYAELVADPNVEAVYIASPHSEHAEQMMLAIEAGKHVLVEKAFTRNAAEARRVVDAARERGVALMEAMWTRFLPRTDIVRQLLSDGVIGEIETVLGDHGQALTHVERMIRPELAGGTLLDLGIYPVSYSFFALGRPGTVRAVGELTDAGVDRQLSITFGDYENHPHAQALLSTTMAARTPTTMAICGDRGRIELDGDFYTPGRVRLVSPSGEAITSSPDVMVGHQGLAHETAHFAQLLADGFTESPQLPLEESVAIMETLDEIRAQVGVRYPGE